ncbi:MAG: hypothetical protein DSZ11_03635 [Sulfurovum sp.]|nr:MAG: hypothetical protein DSZ11_03635 [Sulfurovum sp.]
MRKILLSITLFIISSGVSVASNSFQTQRVERRITSVPHLMDYNRVQTPVRRENNMGMRVMHANYTPRKSMQQRYQQAQRRFYQQPIRVAPRVQHKTQRNPRHIQRVQPQPRRAFNPNSKFAQAQRAAKRGNPNAEFDLAMMYATGDGVEKNPRVAFNLFHRAARKGHVGAKYCMGVNFEKGLGVIKQPELARHWYSIAAKAGHKQAQYKLAQLSRKSNQSLFRNARYSRR